MRRHSISRVAFRLRLADAIGWAAVLNVHRSQIKCTLLRVGVFAIGVLAVRTETRTSPELYSMRLTRLGLLVFFGVLLDIRTSHSAALLTANYSIQAFALDNTCCPPILPLGGNAVNLIGGVVNADYSGQPLLFEPVAQALHGDSVAEMHATARADIGSIGVEIVGGVATNFLGGGSIRAIHVLAGWHDGSVVRSRSRPTGTPLVFNVMIKIGGEMNANVSTPPAPFPAGSAHAFLEVFEESPNFNLPAAPYPAGSWAQMFEDPHNNIHINDPAPPVFRVRHVMTVGQLYQMDYNMRLRGDADAGNGGASFMTANFSQSLKWGGVESVTDIAGNPIPREDWTIESESGFDYSRSYDEQQVPEPSSVALLSFALCLWLGRARKCG